ncbi:MAG: 3-hydroxyacyl-CoA dehydrogenase NAD-binding domain-containing protein [Ferrovibrionaceae bacterium]
MIDYEVDGDGIATIAWNMADRPMNVLNNDSVGLFAEKVQAAIKDAAVKGVIITSKKADFVAGADLTSVTEAKSADEMMQKSWALQSVFRAIEKSGKPFVAAINGTALGGGYEICLACHYRIAADNPKTLIGLPEVSIGLLPGAGGTQRLPRMIGIRNALPLILEGKKQSVDKALAQGLVDKVVPAAELLAQARQWLLTEGPKNTVKPWDKKGFRVADPVQSPKGYETFTAGNAMAREKSFGNYPAVRNILACVYEGLQVDIDNGLKIESRYFVNCAMSPQARNMIRSLFFGINEANKLAGRPAGVPTARYQKVGILGAGMMGAGIAYVSAVAGLEVVLLDSTIEAAGKGKAYSQGLLDKKVARGGMTAAERDAILARITPTVDYADLKGCELVIEAVFENREIKADVTAKAEAVIGADAIFASNTSTLPISGLAQASSRPANFIGLHFFSPVDKMPLVEIILGKETSPECLARAMDYVKRIRKTPIVVNDFRGFYTSRVFATYVNEGLAMLAEGVAPALIDNAGRMAGMPVGPLALADEVALDLMLKVRKQTQADLGDAYRPAPSDPVVALMVEKLGRVGKKAGKGFYDYPADGAKKHLWAGLAEHFPLAKEQPDVAEVKKRLMYIQSIETARCLEENVVTNVRDADVGSILGWGFAPFLGGTLSQIDTVGSATFVAECDRLAQKYGARFTPPNSLRDMAAKGEGYHGPAAKAAA